MSKCCTGTQLTALREHNNSFLHEGRTTDSLSHYQLHNAVLERYCA